MRGKLKAVPVVLGSATPSLESYYNSQKGKYILSKLQQRADAAVIPQVTIVNMQKEFEKAKGYTSFSEQLLSGIEKRKTTGEQTILFLNRRGYHTTLLCQDCGHVVKCRHCDVALTFHKGANHLACHLCGHTLSPPPQQCCSCKSAKTLKFRGVGTEQIEKALHAIFPDIRTIRIDADTTKHQGSHQKLLRDFGSGKADVLIGTQMIAKGLHFPEVTLVGVLNSDATIQIPDFRASEVAFQLITQVSGRSGRGSSRGEVILQTSMPDNFTIQMGAQQDFEKFYAEEIAIREFFKYPPFSRMVKIAFSGKNETLVQEVGGNFRKALATQLETGYELFPLIPAGHLKVKDKYRYQFLIRGSNVYQMNRAIEAVQLKLSIPSTIQISIDVDPLSTFF
jgi:primosomal protein N' (replication factor Y)